MLTILNRLRGTQGLWSKIIGFPIACEIGYLLRDKISFEKYGLEFRGGWELQEGAYGLMQDLVLITLGVSYVLAV